MYVVGCMWSLPWPVKRNVKDEGKEVSVGGKEARKGGKGSEERSKGI